MTSSLAHPGARPTRPALIALGSNLGDRLATLRAAIDALRREPGIAVVATSPIYETAPEGGPVDLPYLNACAVLDVTLDPRALLERLLAIERGCGRVRSVRNAPRTLDLDLLFLDDEIRDDPDLTLPHPRMLARTFVLKPAADIAPLWRHPKTGRTILDHHRDLLPVADPRQVATFEAGRVRDP